MKRTSKPKGKLPRKYNGKDPDKVRRESRKAARKEKKAKKHEYFSRKKIDRHSNQQFTTKTGGNKNVNSKSQKDYNNESEESSYANVKSQEFNQKLIKKKKSPEEMNQAPIKKKKTPEEIQKKKADAKERKLQEEADDLRKQRVIQLNQANAEEDRLIKKLEKDLKLNKRKSKSMPKSFVDDGLDYLLEFCDSEKRAGFIAAEKHLDIDESGSEFEEDYALATGKQKPSRKNNGGDSDDNILNEMDADVVKPKKVAKKRKLVDDADDAPEERSSKQMFETKKVKTVHFEDDEVSQKKSSMKKVEENSSKESSKKMALVDDILNQLKLQKEMKTAKPTSKKSKVRDEAKMREQLLFGNDGGVEGAIDDGKAKRSQWEDIYGRTRDGAGNVLPSTKYVPPHLRAVSGSDDKALLKLRKQMKGLLNRLAESNVKSIADQIEALYMANSRHDTSQALTGLVTEALVAPVLTPDRLVAEHVLLVAILHANVGSEVGAHLLQTVAKRFDELFKSNPPAEDKHLENVVLLLSHMYNFKVFSSNLVYDVLNLLTEKFGPKEIELIIIILKTVGANLRRDNPMALKDLIGRMQVKAGAMVGVGDGTRVRFTMDVLLAIKNNNMNKIPNYDTSHADHLKKIIKSFLRQGNYVTELSISLEDLLNADERGRWWVVGSAWSGSEPRAAVNTSTTDQPTFSTELLALARKQRMNTETRRNIFCIVMTAEDYLDAFEKLLHLGLRNQQEREIVHVLVDCCMQEKTYNPYYMHLANKFCTFDRKYQMAIQYLVWDKLKELGNMLPVQMNNLAKFLSGMFLEPQGLPLSVLKVIHFSEVDKATVRLVRRTLLGLLMAEPVESVLAAFARVTQSEKLRLFREGLRLFLHHFVLRNTASLPEDELQRLKERVKLADQALAVADPKTLF